MKTSSEATKKSLDAINNYFDKIYLLTIERNLDRIEACRQNLAGINFTIFIGADGKQLDLVNMEQHGEYDSALMKKNSGDDVLKYLGLSAYYDPNPNMVACSLSHKMIYQDIVKNGYQRVLVLEDDAQVLDNNIHLFTSITKQLPTNWDVLYLGYLWKYDNSFIEGFKRRYIYPLVHFSGLRKYNPSLVKHGFTKPYTRNLLRAGTHGGTHAYAISGRGAEFMLKHQSPIQNNPDLAFWEPIMQGKLQGYSSKPMLFEPTGGESTIFTESKQH